MGTGTIATLPKEQQKLSLLGKAWRVTKDFVKGTLYALPMTAISSGAALGLSLLISNMTGGAHDPLGVSDKFLSRWLGSTGIFALVAGALKAYEGWNKPLDAEENVVLAESERKKTQLGLGLSRGFELPANAPATPQVANKGQKTVRGQEQLRA